MFLFFLSAETYWIVWWYYSYDTLVFTGLDGSTSSSEREKMINQFNGEPNKWLFLLSTR